MALDQDKSFYCVVDGMVQVYAKTGRPPTDQTSSWDDDNTNGYQLLNEVGSGGTLSSLFTILSLFTEDVKMSYQSGGDAAPNTESRRARRANSDVSQFDLEKARKAGGHQRRSSVSSSTSTVLPSLQQFCEDDGDDSGLEPRTPAISRQISVVPSPQIYHGLVARANEDTTLAVIPAEAFRRLTKQFPKATGHIVQGSSQ